MSITILKLQLKARIWSSSRHLGDLNLDLPVGLSLRYPDESPALLRKMESAALEDYKEKDIGESRDLTAKLLIRLTCQLQGLHCQAL